jgi:hypothetical protein
MPHDRRALEEELERLARAARVRRSVDGFTRAAVEGFCWAVVAGICGRLFWDSNQPPIFLWPMLLLDVLLLWDAVRVYRRAHANLRRELLLEARVRELRVELGIDAPPQTRALEGDRSAGARAEPKGGAWGTGT